MGAGKFVLLFSLTGILAVGMGKRADSPTGAGFNVGNEGVFAGNCDGFGAMAGGACGAVNSTVFGCTCT